MTSRGAAGRTRPGGRLDVTVLGSGPASPQRDSGGSGILLSHAADRVLVDCGPGVATQLARRLDPTRLTAVVVSHFHADHFLDIVPIRYAFAWSGAIDRRLRVIVPPGGTARLEALAAVVSERVSFFSDAFDIVEFDPAVPLTVGSLRIGFVAARHYIPAWSLEISVAGVRIVYTGDTAPSSHLASLARGADLLLTEATIGSSDEDGPERGHLTLDEALELVSEAGPDRAVLVHYPAGRREEIVRRGAGMAVPVIAGRPGTRISIPTRE